MEDGNECLLDMSTNELNDFFDGLMESLFNTPYKPGDRILVGTGEDRQFVTVDDIIPYDVVHRPNEEVYMITYITADGDTGSIIDLSHEYPMTKETSSK